MAEIDREELGSLLNALINYFEGERAGFPEDQQDDPECTGDLTAFIGRAKAIQATLAARP